MNLRQMLIFDEGRTNRAYRDSLGNWSIGVGHLLPADTEPGLEWTWQQVDETFDTDLSKAIRDTVREIPIVLRLDDPRQAVLIGMCFQMGIGDAIQGTGLLGFRRMLAAVRDERYSTAAAEMMDSKWAKQTPVRARRRAYQMETGEWQ